MNNVNLLRTTWPYHYFCELTTTLYTKLKDSILATIGTFELLLYFTDQYGMFENSYSCMLKNTGMLFYFNFFHEHSTFCKSQPFPIMPYKSSVQQCNNLVDIIKSYRSFILSYVNPV